MSKLGHFIKKKTHFFWRNNLVYLLTVPYIEDPCKLGPLLRLRQNVFYHNFGFQKTVVGKIFFSLYVRSLIGRRPVSVKSGIKCQTTTIRSEIQKRLFFERGTAESGKRPSMWRAPKHTFSCPLDVLCSVKNCVAFKCHQGKIFLG